MFCKKCGADMKEGSKFCTNCGQEFVYENNVGTSSKKNENHKNKLFGFKKFIQHIPKPLMIIVPIVFVVIVVIIIFATSFNNHVDTMTYEEFIDRFNEEANAIDKDKVNGEYNNHLSNSSWKEETIDVSGEEGKIEEMVSYTCYPTGKAYCIQIEAYKDSHVVKSLSVKQNEYTMENFKEAQRDTVVDYYGKKMVMSSIYNDAVENMMRYSVIANEVFLGLTYDEALDLMDKSVGGFVGGDTYKGHVKGDVYVKPCIERENIVETWSGFTMEHKELGPNDKPTIESRDRTNSTKNSDLNEESSTNKSHITNSSNTTTGSETKTSTKDTTTNSNPILYDEAKILSDEESKEILNILSSASGDADIAMVFLTTDTDDGTKDSQLGQLDIFVESYYNNNLKDKTQAKDRAWILGYDNNSKQFVMRSFGDFEGEVHLPFTTYERKQMSENIEQALNNKSYVSAVKAFVNEQ